MGAAVTPEQLSPASSLDSAAPRCAVGLKRPRVECDVTDSDEEFDPSLPVGKLTAQIREYAALTSRPVAHLDKQGRYQQSVLENSFPTRAGPRVGPAYQAVLPEFPAHKRERRCAPQSPQGCPAHAAAVAVTPRLSPTESTQTDVLHASGPCRQRGPLRPPAPG